VRIIQLSDIHVWRYSWNPLRLMSKRTVGIVSLMAGRAKKFRLERLEAVIDHVKGLEPDHVLITGDLTTTALPGEFADARKALEPLLADPSRVTVIPGNHDRYTTGSVRRRHFEEAFGAFMPKMTFPWLRPLDARTAILGLDATRSHLSPTGRLPVSQLDEARSMLADPATRPPRLIVA
jgi:3',5'-cyclic AMP phosphodiesterase CpdA